MPTIWIISHVALWCFLLLLGVVVVALLRQIGVLLQRVGPRGAMEDEALPVGSALPEKSIPILGGTSSVTLRGEPDRQLAILFATPSCSLCGEISRAFSQIAYENRDAFRSVVVVSASTRESQQWASTHPTPAATVLSEDRAIEALGIPYTPFVAIVDLTGTVRAAGLVNSAEQIDGLFHTAANADLVLSDASSNSHSHSGT
jgi:methylamine dehydrogenase accessory protein MauD